MEKREPLMDPQYFVNILKFREENIPLDEQVIRDPQTKPKHRSRLRYSIFRQSYEVLITRYSQGESISKLAESFPQVIALLESYLSEPLHESFHFDNIDDYIKSLWLVSLAIIFDVEDPIFDRLLKLIDNEGKDKLFERLVAARRSGRSTVAQIIWPKPYQALDAAIDADQENQSKLFQKFLKSWYSSLKDCYWHDNHKGPDGGGFFGYWAIEAAAIVKVFRINDSSFRDMAYYPKDLVHGLVNG